MCRRFATVVSVSQRMRCVAQRAYVVNPSKAHPHDDDHQPAPPSSAKNIYVYTYIHYSRRLKSRSFSLLEHSNSITRIATKELTFNYNHFSLIPLFRPLMRVCVFVRAQSPPGCRHRRCRHRRHRRCRRWRHRWRLCRRCRPIFHPEVISSLSRATCACCAGLCYAMRCVCARARGLACVCVQFAFACRVRTDLCYARTRASAKYGTQDTRTRVWVITKFRPIIRIILR